MSRFEELLRKLYQIGILPHKNRYALSEEERERLAERALLKLENGLVPKLRSAGEIYLRPSHVREAFRLDSFLGIELSVPVKKPRTRGKPKAKKTEKRSPKLEELLGIGGSRGKRARRLKIEPEPFSRDVFYVRNHDELPILRKRHFSKRLEMALRIAEKSGFIEPSSVRSARESIGASPSGVLSFLSDSPGFGDSGRLAGLVFSKRSAKNGYVIELEDSTGIVEVFVPDALVPRFNDLRAFKAPDGRIVSLGELIVPDEAIYVKVRNSSGRLVAEEIHRPGEVLAHIVRNLKQNLYEDRDFSILFVSDTHAGSKHSLVRKLGRLRRRMRDPSGAPEAYKEILAKAEYVLVGGDLVDGVGVFPGQENELEIIDPEKQYELFAEVFSEAPAEVIAIPGNHDPTTTVVPQPVPEYASPLKESGIKITQNPAFVEIDGFRVAMYHGRSMEDLVLYTPIQLQDVPQLMRRIALSNLFVPIYGGKEALRPDPDRAFEVATLERYPHVLFMGHIHVAAIARFGPMVLINGGTAQTTPEEKVMNIEPTPGRFVAFDLKTRQAIEISILRWPLGRFF